jgi:hypothetical protein
MAKRSAKGAAAENRLEGNGVRQGWMSHAQRLCLAFDCPGSDCHQLLHLTWGSEQHRVRVRLSQVEILERKLACNSVWAGSER